jgi:hypothetical protein
LYSLATFSTASLPPRGKDKLVVVLDLYLDESGIHGSKYCIAGGFLAPSTVWGPWEERWRKILDIYRVTTFHSKRFFARDDRGSRLDDYKGWSDGKAIDFIGNLARLAGADNGLTPIVYAVNVPEFNACTVHERHYLTGAHWINGKWRFMGVPSKPHGAVFTLAVNHALENHTQPVNLFHDEQHVYAPYLLKLNARARAHNIFGGRVGPLVFDSKSNLVPLQAADLIAYCTYQILTHEKAKTAEIQAAFNGLRSYRRPYRKLEGIWLERLLSKVPDEIRKGTTRSQIAKALRAERKQKGATPSSAS